MLTELQIPESRQTRRILGEQIYSTASVGFALLAQDSELDAGRLRFSLRETVGLRPGLRLRYLRQGICLAGTLVITPGSHRFFSALGLPLSTSMQPSLFTMLTACQVVTLHISADIQEPVQELIVSRRPCYHQDWWAGGCPTSFCHLSRDTVCRHLYTLVTRRPFLWALQ